MSLYRKIHLEMYADEKYRALSRPQPCGQVLWNFLLTGPHTTAIPGLSSTGEAALAEMLEWSLKDFRKAFGEIESKGMVKADWKNRVVWIPKAIKYNPPESPNVVKSWGKQWGMIPQCELKAEARKSIIELLSDRSKYGPGFRKAFREAFKEDLPEGPPEVDRTTFDNPSGNQQQEQKQKQEQQLLDDESLANQVRDFIQKHPGLPTWNQKQQDGLFKLVSAKGWREAERLVQEGIAAKAAWPIAYALGTWQNEEQKAASEKVPPRRQTAGTKIYAS